ncbi:MAG: aminopeptidase P N-terminal domain-containing protein [Planctomycetota bacterium]
MSRDAILDPALHRSRRQRLLNALGDGVLLLATAPESARNGDVLHEYRPGSDFHFLTGFPEPQAVLVAWRIDRNRHRTVLFVRPRDPEREVREGRRHGVAGARARFGADRAHPIAQLWQRLPELLAGQTRLFHRLGADVAFDRRLIETFVEQAKKHRRRQPAWHPTITDPVPAVAALRHVKDAAELAALRGAAAISVAGHLAAMRAARPGSAEFEVQAALEAEFRRAGSPRNGYPSIVASGANACILHYHENDRTMRAGDLVLVDAGAEFAGCTADITRTFPVSGRFTPDQAAVYQVVLRAQLAGIRACKVGAPWDRAHKVCLRSLTRGLVGLRVLRGKVARLLKKERYKRFYMHGTSHWLGRDVHDVGAYLGERDKPRRLVPGAVLTVEPGLYFGSRDKKVPKALRGIGIRIEDDVLVTARGPVVLTAGVPKLLADVERACGGRSP